MTATGLTTGAALATAAAGATATATTTTTAAALTLRAMFAATVSVGRMALAMALTVVDARGAATGLRLTALGALAAGATATTATTATTIAVGSTFTAALSGAAGLGTVGAGEGRRAGFRSGGAEKTLHPAENTSGFLDRLTGVTGGSRSAVRMRNRTRGRSRGVVGGAILLTIAGLLLGTTVAFLGTIAAAATTTTLTIAAAVVVTTGSVASSVGSRLKHRNLATADRAEHATVGLKRRTDCGSRGFGGSLRGLSGRLVTLVRESRCFPALGRVLHLGRREDVELGLGGGSSGLNNSRDGRGRSGGRGLRGFGNNGCDRSCSDRSRSGHGSGG